MALRGPILLIEDDENDADVIKAAIEELGVPNELIIFQTAAATHQYLLDTADKPLLLLCDVHMPVLDGLSLLRQIQSNESLRLKAIPFIFLSGVASQEVIDEAFYIGIQGFYTKPYTYIALKDMVRTIITYWLSSQHPSARYVNTYDPTRVFRNP